MPDGTSRFSHKGKPIFHYMGCSTFSNFTVLPEIAVAKIREDAPFDKSCYIGLRGDDGRRRGVSILAKVTPGANVVYSVSAASGSTSSQGAKMVGADKIVRRRHQRFQGDWAARFGMTHFVNPTKVSDIVQHLVGLTDGGADFTFDCTGNTNVMRQALEACHRGWGVSVIIGSQSPARKFATRRSNWSPAASGRERPLAARAAARTCRNRRLVHERKDRNRSDDHARPQAGGDQPGIRSHASGQVDPLGCRVLKLENLKHKEDRP